MKPCVNLAETDWQVSWQKSVALSTYIRYSGVTKMFDVIKNNIRDVIFEKNAVGILPHWVSCPTLPYII